MLQALKSEYAEHARERHSSAELSVLWVGSADGMEVDLVKRAGISFQAIPAAGVHGVGLRALPGNLIKLGKGYFKSRSILRQFKPDVLFFTGGYVAIPMALAGRNYPIGLYVPDIEPGLALKVLAHFADRVAITTKDSMTYFQDKSGVLQTGYPTRPELHAWNKIDAKMALGLDQTIPVLLVFGGSKGSRSINRALHNALSQLLGEMQVIHITGNLDWDEVRLGLKVLEKQCSEVGLDFSRYRPYPYLHQEMGAALSAADLVVARAGASTLGEFPLFHLPAILVPYPYAWRYQKVNADYLVRKEAAIVLADENLTEKLAPAILGLIRDCERLEKMSQAMGRLSMPEAAGSIANMIENLAWQKSQKGIRQ